MVSVRLTRVIYIIIKGQGSLSKFLRYIPRPLGVRLSFDSLAEIVEERQIGVSRFISPLQLSQ